MTKPTPPPAPRAARATNTKSGIGKRRAAARREGTDSYHERRREIARVAAELFNRNGYRGTSLGAVAKAMGVDRASLYYYIGSKEELFDEVVREVSEENAARAEAIRDTDATPSEKLRSLIVALMNSYADNYPLLYVYIRENLNHVAGQRTAWSRHMKAINKRYEEAVIAIVDEGMADGSFHAETSARIVAFGVLGMVGWTNRWFNPHHSDETAEEVGAAYADLVLRGLER